uniref:Uncharacterized protein n=1 Tax=Arion vulgaris TaxID=1028688 RepID=A0A0B6Z6Z4_9EUPU
MPEDFSHNCKSYGSITDDRIELVPTNSNHSASSIEEITVYNNEHQMDRIQERG